LTPEGGIAHERWREPLGALLAAVLLALMVLGYLMPVTGWFSAVPGGLGDARFNSVVLEHLYRVAAGHGERLWDPGFFFPYQGVLAFSDNHFGSGATYIAFRALGLSREHAFDAWFVVGSVLNFVSALYVLRRLGLSTAAAALGAFFYAFALPVPAKDGHAQLVHRFAAPLATLALWQMFELRRLAGLARVVFFVVWQFYCSIYLGLFLVYLLLALSLAILILRRPLEWRQWRANLAAERPALTIALGVLLAGSALAFAYLACHYYLASQAYGLSRHAGAIAEVLPRPASYLLADASPLWAWLGSELSVPARWEQQMFIGAGALILILVAACAAWRRRAALPGLTEVMLTALAALFVGTLWIDDVPVYAFIARLPGGLDAVLGAALLTAATAAIVAWRARTAVARRAGLIVLGVLALGALWLRYLTLYHLISWLPGIDGIRAVARIIFIMLVPMSVLVALGAEVVWRRLGQSVPSAVLVLAGLAALLAVEPLTTAKQSTPIATWRGRVAAVRALLPASVPSDGVLMVRTGSAALHQPFLSEAQAVELDAMLLGQDLGYPVLNGYSGFAPPGYRAQPLPCASAAERLDGHARFMGGAAAGASHARRLLILELNPC
jgi:hypothetical protein